MTSATTAWHRHKPREQKKHPRPSPSLWHRHDVCRTLCESSYTCALSCACGGKRESCTRAKRRAGPGSARCARPARAGRARDRRSCATTTTRRGPCAPLARCLSLLDASFLGLATQCESMRPCNSTPPFCVGAVLTMCLQTWNFGPNHLSTRGGRLLLKRSFASAENVVVPSLIAYRKRANSDRPHLLDVALNKLRASAKANTATKRMLKAHLEGPKQWRHAPPGNTCMHESTSPAPPETARHTPSANKAAKCGEESASQAAWFANRGRPPLQPRD